jgi:hypothetical protein
MLNHVSSFTFFEWGVLVAILDEGTGSNEIEQSYWMRAINWTHGF